MQDVDYRATLLAQFDALKPFSLFERMQQTVEDSPWHREANVLLHTDMVVNQYVHATDVAVEYEERKWNRTDYLGGIACVFHDVGKPDAEIKKFSEQRGTYRAYHGHELLSARLFESYATHRFPMFFAEDIFKVCWMIEHHLLWSVEDPQKINNLAMTASWIGAGQFSRFLLADQAGRVSDDGEAKMEKTMKWMHQFMQVVNQVSTTDKRNDQVQDVSPTLWCPIAPSGAGKSTYLKTLRQELAVQGKTVRVFSLDALRHEFYDANDYAKAYELAVADKTFESRANTRFLADLRQCASDGADMYVDNTNLSARRRRWYLDNARRLGFKTVAVVMPVELDVLLARQKTRGDKCVPDAAVRQQYNSLQMPSLGEFDEIVTSNHNMVKQ